MDISSDAQYVLYHLGKIKQNILSLEKIYDEIYKEEAFMKKGYFSLCITNDINKTDYLPLDDFYLLFSQSHISLSLDFKELNISQPYRYSMLSFFTVENKNIHSLLTAYFLSHEEPVKTIHTGLSFPDSKINCGALKMIEILGYYTQEKEVLKEKFLDESSEVKVQLLQLLNHIAVYDKEFINEFLLEIQSSLTHEMIDVQKTAIELLKNISQTDSEFVRKFFPQIKDILCDKYQYDVADELVAIFEIISQKDFDFVKSFFSFLSGEEYMNKNEDIVYGVSELLKMIAKKDFDFVKEILQKYDQNLSISGGKILVEANVKFVIQFFEENIPVYNTSHSSPEEKNTILEFLIMIAPVNISYVIQYIDKVNIFHSIMNEEYGVKQLILELLKIIEKIESGNIHYMKYELKQCFGDIDNRIKELVLDILEIGVQKDGNILFDYEEELRQCLQNEEYNGGEIRHKNKKN